MTIDSLSGSALTAVQRGQQQASSAAAKIAKSGTTAPIGEAAGRLLQGTVELKQAEHLAQAGSKLLAAADQMLGSLIDVKA